MSTTVGFGVSETLCSIFDGLSQTEGLNGQKYADNDINKVKQYVVCRNYSKACLELSYLCWAVVNAYPTQRGVGNLEAFFWLDDAYTAKRFREAFKQSWQGNSGNVVLTQLFLNVKVDSKTFSISPSRVAVLAVLMEFVITVDPTLITIIQSSLQAGNSKTIDQVAKRIQKAIYQFLKEHLPEAQIQTRYRYFELWLKANKHTPSSIDDAAIMTFWQDASEDPHAQSYVLYSTALFDVLDALNAIKVVDTQQNLAFAASFGFAGESTENWASGEIDPEHIAASELNNITGEAQAQQVHSLLFSELTEDTDIKTLCQAPKCLTQEEVHWLQPLSDYAMHSQTFALSFMRLQVFARWQSVLVQAKRKSLDTLVEKLAEAPVHGYAMYQLEMSGLSQALTYAQDCLLYVLFQRDPELACAELLQKLPQDKLPPIASYITKQVAHSSTPWNNLPKQLYLQFPAFKQLIAPLEAAFKKNNKAGFKTLPNQDNLENYINALQQITKLQALLHKHEGNIFHIDAGSTSLSSIFSSDVCIFTKRFNTLYGGLNAN